MTGLEALRERVAVKPLEWGGNVCQSLVGYYQIEDHGVEGVYWSLLGIRQGRRFGSVTDAKAAAQADYEARVLSALIAQQVEG